MDSSFPIPPRLKLSCQANPDRALWLEELPSVTRRLSERWALSLSDPFAPSGACSWVAPATRANGERVVLKIGMPHMEAEHEIDGLRFWAGEPTVRLLEADDDEDAMVLEYCDPGVALRLESVEEQDRILAQLLHQLWRSPPAPHPFRHLSAMTSHWCEETSADCGRWPDVGLVREGIRVFEELSVESAQDVLLATDLHAGNVLSAQRHEWLVIDPKPFIGDAAYDATQHLFNTGLWSDQDPEERIFRFAEVLGVEPERVRLWIFARAAAEPRDVWNDHERLSLARRLAP
jgi:streptomycin 6-kinase